MTTTLAASDATCSMCERAARCLLVTIANDLGDMRRSALTLRTMTAPVCFGCIDKERVKREPGKRHLWHDTGDSIAAAVVRAACEGGAMSASARCANGPKPLVLARVQK